MPHNLDGTEADGWKLRLVRSSVSCGDSGTLRCFLGRDIRGLRR